MFKNIRFIENWEDKILGGRVSSGDDFMRFYVGIYSIIMPLELSIKPDCISSRNTGKISITNLDTNYTWSGDAIFTYNGEIKAGMFKIPKPETYVFNKLLFNYLIYSVYNSSDYGSYYCEKSNSLHLFGQYSFINTCKTIVSYRSKNLNFLKLYCDGTEFTSWEDGSYYMSKGDYRIVRLNKSDALQHYNNANKFIERNFDKVIIKDFR